MAPYNCQTATVRRFPLDFYQISNVTNPKRNYVSFDNSKPSYKWETVERGRVEEVSQGRKERGVCEEDGGRMEGGGGGGRGR